MSHKADKTWFDHKRTWSKSKDKILTYYLEPYLAKVRRLGRPVLLVDAFAGPGKYEDGEIGSPMFLCAKAQKFNSMEGPRIFVWCIEPDLTLFDQLQNNLTRFTCARAINGRFLDRVEEIGEAVKTHTLFLYIDPFTVAVIDWKSITNLAALIHSAGASVEILLNFNTAIFIRCALAAMKKTSPSGHTTPDEANELDLEPEVAPSLDRLDSIVGGNWWHSIISKNIDFPQMVREVAERVNASLRELFGESCWVWIKKKIEHHVPVYHMFFASRHPHALELMNDAMVKGLGQSEFEVDMFAHEELDEVILKGASAWIPRGELILAVIRQLFCRYYQKEIRARIEVLMRRGLIESETGKIRINDSTRVKRT